MGLSIFTLSKTFKNKFLLFFSSSHSNLRNYIGDPKVWNSDTFSNNYLMVNICVDDVTAIAQAPTAIPPRLTPPALKSPEIVGPAIDARQAVAIMPLLFLEPLT